MVNSPRCRKKVCVLISGPLPPPIGGMQTYCEDYFKTDIPKDFNVIFCNCILIKRMPEAKGLWGLFLRCLNRVFTLVVRLYMRVVKRPDIVHVHTDSGVGFYPRGLMTFWAKQFGAKAILHMHGAEFKEFYNALTPARQRLTKRFLIANSVLLVLSKEWQQFFASIGIAPEKIVVKTNSVFLPDLSERNENRDRLVVLYLSRIEERKGVYELLDAIKNYPELRERFSFVIAGPGTHSSDDVRTRVASLGFSDFVEMPGPLVGKDKDKAYRNADIYLLQSFAEGMPIGLLEAMSYGLACITTPVGGIPDVVRDRKNGLLIPPGDPRALAEALKLLAGDSALTDSMGRQARRTIEERFSWETHAEEISRLYYRILDDVHKQETNVVDSAM